MEDFWSAPPVARTWTAATLTTSVLIYGRIINGSRFIFWLPYVFKFPVPEIWRILSAFWITGPDWAILYDTYFCTWSLPCASTQALTVHSMDVLKQSRKRVTALYSTR
ncbi:MAG: hypothetical protein Q9193_001600 [Seirophora villosa]